MWKDDPIMKKVLNHLIDYHKNISLINYKFQTTTNFNLYVTFSYPTAREGVVQYIISDSTLEYIIDNYNSGMIPKMWNSIISPLNITAWIDNMYCRFAYREYNKQKSNPFTDSYKQSNNRRGNAKSWNSAFDDMFNGASDFNANRQTKEEDFFRKFWEEGNTRKSDNDYFNETFGKNKNDTPPPPKPAPDGDFFKSRNNPTPRVIFLAELNLTISATDKEIRAAWINLTKIWHPDKNSHRIEESKTKITRINQAYQMLKR